MPPITPILGSLLNPHQRRKPWCLELEPHLRTASLGTLVNICREHGLGQGGSKKLIALRIIGRIETYYRNLDITSYTRLKNTFIPPSSLFLPPTTQPQPQPQPHPSFHHPHQTHNSQNSHQPQRSAPRLPQLSQTQLLLPPTLLNTSLPSTIPYPPAFFSPSNNNTITNPQTNIPNLPIPNPIPQETLKPLPPAALRQQTLANERYARTQPERTAEEVVHEIVDQVVREALLGGWGVGW